MVSNTTSSTDTAARELVVTRVFDASRERVFDAFTDPRHIAEWWGPDGFTNTIHEMDVRPGGVWRFMMHGPDGVDYPNMIIYAEIVKPERLVFPHGEDGADLSAYFQATVTFEDLDGETRLTMRTLFSLAEERDSMVEFGALEGGNQTLGRLAAFLATTGQLAMSAGGLSAR